MSIDSHANPDKISHCSQDFLRSFSTTVPFFSNFRNPLLCFKRADLHSKDMGGKVWEIQSFVKTQKQNENIELNLWTVLYQDHS